MKILVAHLPLILTTLDSRVARGLPLHDMRFQASFGIYRGFVSHTAKN